MSKRIIVAAIAALVLASTASAAITISPAPAGPGYQNLSPWTCNGRTFYLSPVAGVSGSGLPIRLVFGWGTHTASQMSGFFQNSHGSVTISGSDSFYDSWANSPSGSPFVSQQGITWSALEPQTLTPPGGGATVQGVTSIYRGVLSLAPGTYTLSVSYVFDKPVQDGFAIYKGTLGGSCTFTVAA